MSRKQNYIVFFLFLAFASCTMQSGDYMGSVVLSPDDSLSVTDYVQRSDNSDSKFYLLQLILKDENHKILDSVNTHISGTLPYHIEWLSNSRIAIKGTYQVTRLYDVKGGELKRDREWNDNVKAIDNMMWEKLSKSDFNDL